MTVRIEIVGETVKDVIEEVARIAAGAEDGRGKPLDMDGLSVEAIIEYLNDRLADNGMEVSVVEKSAKEKKAAPKKAPAKKDKKAKPEKEEEESEPETEDTDTEEDFNKAVDLLAECYAEDDGKEQVKALLEEYGVKKFSEVEVSKGTELLKKAEKIKASL